MADESSVTPKSGSGKSAEWRAEMVRDLQGDVLEIGVGEGENLHLYRRATSICAIEPDAKRAAAARVVAAQISPTFPITVEVAHAEQLPYEDARFDHVVSSLVFCSVNAPEVALREIRRVLRPDGVLHMMEHVRPNNPLLAALFGTVTPLWKRMAWNCHLDRPTIDTLRDAGWQVKVHKRRFVFVRLTARPIAGGEPAAPSGR